MNITLPTDLEFEKMKSKSPRTDYSEVYKTLAEHGRLVLDTEPKNIRTALSNYYRKGRKRARVIKQDDGRCLIYLEVK